MEGRAERFEKIRERHRQLKAESAVWFVIELRKMGKARELRSFMKALYELDSKSVFGPQHAYAGDTVYMRPGVLGTAHAGNEREVFPLQYTEPPRPEPRRRQLAPLPSFGDSISLPDSIAAMLGEVLGEALVPVMDDIAIAVRYAIEAARESARPRCVRCEIDECAEITPEIMRELERFSNEARCLPRMPCIIIPRHAPDFTMHELLDPTPPERWTGETRPFFWFDPSDTNAR